MAEYSQKEFNRLKNKRNLYESVVDEVDRIVKDLNNYSFQDTYVCNDFAESIDYQPEALLREKANVITTNLNTVRSSLTSIHGELGAIRQAAVNKAQYYQGKMTTMELNKDNG